MIDPQELALAQSYEQLAEMPAFRNLLNWLEEDVLAAERTAENAGPDEKTGTVRAKFIAWQQRKQVLTSIRTKIVDAKEYAQLAMESLENERRIESERAGRGNW